MNDKLISEVRSELSTKDSSWDAVKSMSDEQLNEIVGKCRNLNGAVWKLYSTFVKTARVKKQVTGSPELNSALETLKKVEFTPMKVEPVYAQGTAAGLTKLVKEGHTIVGVKDAGEGISKVYTLAPGQERGEGTFPGVIYMVAQGVTLNKLLKKFDLN